MDKHRTAHMVEITYPYIGEMMIVPEDDGFIYYGHVVVSQGHGVFTNPCKTEAEAQAAAERILEEFMNRR